MSTEVSHRIGTAMLLPRNTVVLAFQAKVVGRLKVPATNNEQPIEASIDATDIIAGLRSELDDRRAELAAIDVKIAEREKAAFDKGLKEGEIIGKANAADDRRKREEAVAKGVFESITLLQRALEQLESRAAKIALASVEQVLGDEKATADRVRQVVSRQLAQFRAASPLVVRVAAADFPDKEPLRGVLNAAGHTDVELVVDSDMESGGCRIGLRLGEVDVGIQQQLNALRGILVGT